MKTVLPLVGLLLCPLAGIAADATAPARPYFAANCFNCHGTEGKAVSAIPSIAGRDKALSGRNPESLQGRHQTGHDHDPTGEGLHR